MIEYDDDANKIFKYFIDNCTKFDNKYNFDIINQKREKNYE